MLVIEKYLENLNESKIALETFIAAFNEVSEDMLEYGESCIRATESDALVIEAVSDLNQTIKENRMELLRRVENLILKLNQEISKNTVHGGCPPHRM